MSLWSRVQRRIGDIAGELVLDEYRVQLDQAQELLTASRTSDAIEVLEALLLAKPDHGQALIVLGEAHLVARAPQAALAAFERALKLRPGDPAASVGAGLSLVALGRYEPAITALGRAVGEAAGDRAILAEAYRGLGTAWRRRGDLDKAIRELRKAVAEDSSDADARAWLGEALVAEAGAGGPYDEARRHLERAAATDPPPALALYALGRLALLEPAPATDPAAPSGEDWLDRARAHAERDSTPLGAQIRFDILVAQGDAALAAGDAGRAHGFFLEALQVEPRRSELHARIAFAHRSIGNLSAALASYDRALALGAGEPTLRAAVDTAIAAGDVQRQASWANDLLARDPGDVRAIVARGASLADTQPDAARALLALAAARDDVDGHIGLARLALPTDPTAAATAALSALRVAPQHSAARQILSAARAAQFGAPGRDIAELAGFLQRLVGQRRELGHLVGEVARAAANLDQPLLVTVMGEFSSGKSSFVNAFIGAEVAPTGITPTTATINVVRYGRERGGRIVDATGTASELGWDALMAQLKHLTPEAARAIDRVEILVPLPQLEKINIVDTPGLNSIQPEHEATARGFIAKADAIIWVFTASQGGKASEQRALRSIRDEGKRVLGVLNKADQLSPDETREVVEFITGQLGDLVETIVPFAARRALAWKTASAPPPPNPQGEQAHDPHAAPPNPQGKQAHDPHAAPPNPQGKQAHDPRAAPPNPQGKQAHAPHAAPPNPQGKQAHAPHAAPPNPQGERAHAPHAARPDARGGEWAGSAGPEGAGKPPLNDGNWAALEAALEHRFFQQARELKRDACARALRGVVSAARGSVDALYTQAREAAEAARAGRDALLGSAREFALGPVVAERKALSDATAALYRRAAREVLDLVRPRRLPFASHSATTADRDYLIALLSSGYDAAIEAGRHRVAAELAARARLSEPAARTLSAALGGDVVGDLERTAADRIGLALSHVFDRSRAFLRGYLEGGYVEAFFRNDVPRLELAEDAVYHALSRAAPDLDRELGEPLARAASDALTALARRLEHWAAVIDVHAFDLEVGVGRALELAEVRL
jgi:Tfp pilus assembly protein PilF/GTPase SAR1 family protein